MEPHAAPDRQFILSVGKCFQLLECLNAAQRPLTLTELVQSSALEKSAVQRLTHTLKELGYLRQHPRTRAYTLSGRMLEFGHTVLSTDGLRKVADPHLRRLNQACNETVNLMELEGRDIVYIARYASIHPVSVNLHVGSRLPAFCTAAGRAILAFLPSGESQAVLRGKRDPMTQYTVTDAEQLQSMLVRIRAEGYVVNDQEAFIGDISIAAPILNSAREVVGAINIAVPLPRWTVEMTRRKLVPLVLKSAREISADLGWTSAGQP